MWTQDSTDVDDTAEAFDDFGNALAAADLNGDGTDDLAIGVFGEDVNGISSAGAVSILFGTGGGLQATSPADQFLFQGNQGIRDTPEVGDNYGSALSGGDFNGDGTADLAIGVPGEDVVDTDDGAVSVLLRRGGRQQAVSPDDLLLSQSTSDIADEPDFFDGYGAVLSGADFNDDGFADVVVGIPDENLGTAIDAGAANIVYGGAHGPAGHEPRRPVPHPGQHQREGRGRGPGHLRGRARRRMTRGGCGTDRTVFEPTIRTTHSDRQRPRARAWLIAFRWLRLDHSQDQQDHARSGVSLS